jgi:hypothetical protein
MGSDICTSMAGRPISGISITQDDTCVSWTHLVGLRLQYNRIWDKLNDCGVSIVNGKYGEGSHREEINPLPTIEGFFRLTVNATGNVNDGYVCSVASDSDVHFILTGGTLLTENRINTPSLWSYLDSQGARKPFAAQLKDGCKNCSKFHPTTQSPADESISCLGDETTPYAGFIKMNFEQALTGCGDIWDWGENIEELKDHVNNFDCYKTLAPEDTDKCTDTVVSCCEDVYDIGRYETVGTNSLGFEVVALKYVDIYVSDIGDPKLEGYLAPLIYSSEPTQIRDRVEAVINNFSLLGDYLCDSCGPVLDIEGCGPGKGFKCEVPFTFSGIQESTVVAGVSCSQCDEAFSGHICACPWVELAAVMDFILNYGCVIGCSLEDCTCPTTVIVGCMNVEACNYDPSATENDEELCQFCLEEECIDGECIDAPIYGCMDPGAINFNPSATIDDGSCIY